MNKRYLNLFKELMQSSAVLAEQVMDYDKTKEDEAGFEKAKQLRDDFQNTKDRMDSEEDFYPTYDEITYLLTAAIIQIGNLQDRMEVLKKAMAGYQSDLIPKLQAIVDGGRKTDEEVKELVDEKFVIQDEE